MRSLGRWVVPKDSRNPFYSFSFYILTQNDNGLYIFPLFWALIHEMCVDEILRATVAFNEPLRPENPRGGLSLR